MSKSSSTTNGPKTSTQLPQSSAWFRGPPTTSPSPRSQSPAPHNHHPTHSRRPSALGHAVPIKDGVSISRSNVGSVKQGTAVTFGSIDDASAPISSSPAAAPPLKQEGVHSFGSVPAAASPALGHVNGKPSISSRQSALPAQVTSSSSPSSTTTPPPQSVATPAPAPSSSSSAKKDSAPPAAPIPFDIKKLFQNPSSAPSSTPASDTSSPATRNVSLPSQPPHHPQSHPAPPPHVSAPPFVPSFTPRSSQNGGPNNAPPRSPQISRAAQNGAGPRSHGPQNGAAPSPGMSSPRMGPHPPNPAMPNPMPQQVPHQMQPAMHWPGYYHYDPNYAYGWYPHHMPPPPPQTGPAPGQHMQHATMPMSPRNPPSNVPGPGTPTLAHAMPNPVHPPHPAPPISHTPSAVGNLTSPPPTPSTATLPSTNRLNPGSSAFTPSRKVVVKKEDGTEVDLEHLKPVNHSTSATSTPSGNAYRQGSPGTPNRRPVSIRIESEDQRKSRLEEEERRKAEAEAAEKSKKDKEDAARKAEAERVKKQEEAEARRKAEEKKREDEAMSKIAAEEERIKAEEEEKRKAEEAKEAARKAEEERVRKEAEKKRREEEEERKRKEEEEERKRKEEEERKLKEEAERKRREQEERERLEKEEAEKKAEAEAKTKAEAEAKIKAEAEAAAAASDGKPSEEPEEGELVDGRDLPQSIPAKPELREDSRPGLRINTTSPTLDRRRPGPLDLSSAKRSDVSAAPLSALATARVIDDIKSVQYPEGINSPKPELNQNAKEGKFKYDRDFLLQFMAICKEKPPMLPPLDAIGLEPLDPATLAMTRTQSGRRGGPPSRQPSLNAAFPKGAGSSQFAPGGPMGTFTTASLTGSKLTSDERFALANSQQRTVSSSSAVPPFGRVQMQRTPSQGGSRVHKTRSKRGGDRGGPPAPAPPPAGLEPVAPLQVSENRWDRKALNTDVDSPEVVDRKVRALLNKLTMERFDSISDQIIAWANKSEKEKDGRTLIQVIRLVFEKATDEATWSEMYARLCRKMMEQISPKVQDDGIKNNEGKPIAGGQLFRKYLLNRCQEDFERGWVNKEATAAAAAQRAIEDEAIKAANQKSKDKGDEEVELYSDEYYAAQKAKRQGLGLIKFIGELFKLQMLTERIMHECVKKLLGNVDNPEEEEIESLCKLLTTVGSLLDTPKARAHLDVYFTRMKELTKSSNVTSRMQYMLQDIIELRDRKWQPRNAAGAAAPTTIAQVHEAVAKEKAVQETQAAYQRQISMSRGGSRRGADRGDASQVGPDGWSVAGGSVPRPPPKAGDLSNFGKISTKSAPITFGPSSVFAGKKGADKRESISRTASNSNMFSMLSSQTTEVADAAKAPAEPMQRRKIILAPRTKPKDEDVTETASPAAEASSSEDDEASPATPEMTEERAKSKIAEDVKEFFQLRSLDEGETYFSSLPAQHHSKLVDKLVTTAVEAKEADAKLVADVFGRVVSKELCSSAAFEEGLMPIAELIDDIAIDAPKAFHLYAMMVKGASLDEPRQNNLASKSMDSDKLLALIQA